MPAACARCRTPCRSMDPKSSGGLVRIRNGDAECGAFGPRAQHHHIAAVTARELARDGEAEACATDATAAGERFEEMLEHLLRNAAAVVGDVDRRAIIHAARRDRHLT